MFETFERLLMDRTGKVMGESLDSIQLFDINAVIWEPFWNTCISELVGDDRAVMFILVTFWLDFTDDITGEGDTIRMSSGDLRVSSSAT